MNTKFYQSIAVLVGIVTLPLLFRTTSVRAESLPLTQDEAATHTSARELLRVPSSEREDHADDSTETRIAQGITPGRPTRSGPSYIGVGGNIGFGGDTAMGEGNFTVFSKLGLTSNFSARPGIVIGNDPTILLPLTADFPIAPVSENVDFDVAPFVGGGLAISTGSDSLARPLITGGVDVPVADRITLTAQGNVAFFRDTEGSIILGVGYNF